MTGLAASAIHSLTVRHVMRLMMQLYGKLSGEKDRLLLTIYWLPLSPVTTLTATGKDTVKNIFKSAAAFPKLYRKYHG